MTGPYREQEMTPPPSRWVRFWEQMARGHKHGMAGGYPFVFLTVVAGMGFAAFIIHMGGRDIPTGAMCLEECSAASLSVHQYEPRRGNCMCGVGGQ